MTIHGVGYRPLDYRPVGVLARIWPIAAVEYRSLLRRWPGILLFIAFFGPHIASVGILAVQMGIWQIGVDPDYIAARMIASPRMDARAVQFYFNPIFLESFIPFLAISSLVSCRAIAKDRQTDALELYWTRGIGPVGYFAGKWFGSVLLIGTSFVLAPVVIWLLASLMAEDWSLLRETSVFMPRVIAALGVATAIMCYIAVAFSALARHANQASIYWFALLAGSEVLSLVLTFAIFRGATWCRGLSPWNSSQRLGEWICDIPPRYNYSPWVAVAVLGTIVVALTAIVARRLRLEEAVG